MTSRPRFPGLDSVRAYAALFVLFSHVPLMQGLAGLPAPLEHLAMLRRGLAAVSLFFVLSGFLITYLLLDELERSGRVDVRRFYMRRVLRIWPLYFVVVSLGFAHNALLPLFEAPYAVSHPPVLAPLLFVFFLPNLAVSLFEMGPLLIPAWSIGVEEQFYLAWAPVMKRWSRHLVPIAVTVFVLSLVTFALVDHAGPRGLGPLWELFHKLKLHFLAGGALAAWALFHHRERLLAALPFRSRLLRLLLWLWLVQFYLLDPWPLAAPLEEVVQALVYPWLILEVGAQPLPLLHLSTRFTEWLGTISYGLYLLHPIALGLTTLVVLRLELDSLPLPIYLISYYGLAVILVIPAAALSYRLLEGPFLRLKRHWAV